MFRWVWFSNKNRRDEKIHDMESLYMFMSEEDLKLFYQCIQYLTKYV